MMMTLVNALLQPNYSSNDLIRDLNSTKIETYPQCDSGYANLNTEIIPIDTIPAKDTCDQIVAKDTQKENTTIQMHIDIPNNQIITMTLINDEDVGNHNVSIISKDKTGTANAYTPWIYEFKVHFMKRKQSNIYGKNKKGESTNISINFINNNSMVHNVCNIYTILLCHSNYRTQNSRINNMNIKHLKLFKLSNNSNIYHLYVYLHKQLIAIFNLNKNIHINDDIYMIHKLIKHILYNMPNVEEITEIYIKLPVDLYNIIALKVADMTFNDNGWLRLEQLLNILCDTMNGNLNGFDIVWWNMQTCWTSFKKNLNGKWTKEFAVNCEVIPEDEEEIMAVYTILDGKNVPINIELKPKQLLIDLISEI